MPPRPWPTLILVCICVAFVVAIPAVILLTRDNDPPAANIGHTNVRTVRVTFINRTIPCIIAESEGRSGGVGISCDWGP